MFTSIYQRYEPTWHVGSVEQLAFDTTRRQIIFAIACPVEGNLVEQY